MSASRDIAPRLARVVAARIPEASGIDGLRRLSGGASQETWSFDATTPAGAVPLHSGVQSPRSLARTVFTAPGLNVSWMRTCSGVTAVA